MSNRAGAWVLYRLTHSAGALGLEGLCFSLPIAILPWFTGVLADRFNRLTLVKATLAAEAAQAFTLAAVTVTRDLRPWVLYLAAACDAARLAVNIPAQTALVPSVVPADMLFSAMVLSNSTWGSSALAGPAAAGALLTVAGPGLVFAVNGACTLLALGTVAVLRIKAHPPVRGRRRSQLAGGITWLRGHRRVGWLLGVSVVAMTGILAVETLLPVFAARIWHTGPAGYGVLRMTPGIAAVLASATLPMFPSAARHRLALPAAFAVASLSLAGFAAGPPFIAAVVLLAGGSLCLTVSQATAGALIQQAVPDTMRGRIAALRSSGQNGLAGLAAAATAGLATGIGPQLAISLVTVVTAGAGVAMSLLAADHARLGPAERSGPAELSLPRARPA